MNQHDELVGVLDRLYSPRNLSLHRELSKASRIVPGMSLIEFCSQPRSIADYHLRCLTWLQTHKHHTEDDFLAALNAALEEMLK